jgi:hypothetical protein
MTIRNRELNERLCNLERCAELAPEGTYVRSKEAVDTVRAAMDAIEAVFKDANFNVDHCDGARDLEATLYGYLLANNPEEYELYAAEGFGEHVDGPARERVMANTIRDRDFLASLA